MSTKIFRYPEKILTTTCTEVKENELNSLIKAMQFYYDPKTMLGLAAPQVGIAKRIFVTKMGVFINPKFDFKSHDIFNSREMCLSILEPHTVPRHEKVMLTWTAWDGIICTLDFKEQDAVLIQHEMDHLDGKLILSYD